MRTVVLVIVAVVLGGLPRPTPTAWAQPPVVSGTVITVAGNGSPAFAGDGGHAIDVSLNDPLGIAVGPGGTLYIADASNFRIRAVDPTTGVSLDRRRPHRRFSSIRPASLLGPTQCLLPTSVACAAWTLSGTRREHYAFEVHLHA
jgi:hypothetical protein